jgi:3-ketosteroid 9alpha-monooxygenase subunit A
VGQWHSIYKASKLQPGDVVEVTCSGDDLLLYRTESGDCLVVTAYCPHMNSYMPNGLPPESSIRGLLFGDELLCPFHGWRFDTQGRCSGLPAGQRVPPKVRAGHPVLRQWRVREQGGQIQIAAQSPT